MSSNVAMSIYRNTENKIGKWTTRKWSNKVMPWLVSDCKSWISFKLMAIFRLEWMKRSVVRKGHNKEWSGHRQIMDEPIKCLWRAVRPYNHGPPTGGIVAGSGRHKPIEPERREPDERTHWHQPWAQYRGKKPLIPLKCYTCQRVSRLPLSYNAQHTEVRLG